MSRPAKTIRMRESGVYARQLDGRPMTLAECMEHASIGAHFLDKARAIARDVLRHHGIPLDKNGMPRFEDAASGYQGFTPLPDSPLPEIVHDAAELLVHLLGITSSYQLKRVFNAGRTFERMQVRAVEYVAVEGRKKLSGDKGKGDKRRIEKAERWAFYAESVKQLKTANPECGDMESYDKVADDIRAKIEARELPKRYLADARTIGNAYRASKRGTVAK